MPARVPPERVRHGNIALNALSIRDAMRPPRSLSVLAALALSACAHDAPMRERTPRPAAHTEPVTHQWTSRALAALCASPPPAASPSPTPVETTERLPPALARYPHLGRLTTGCLRGATSPGCAPWTPWTFEPPAVLPPRGIDIVLLSDATDCVTRTALARSVPHDAIEACVRDESHASCSAWWWVSIGLRVQAPRRAQVTAMSGDEHTSIGLARCLARSLREASWEPHEGPGPVEVTLVVAWHGDRRDPRCVP